MSVEDSILELKKLLPSLDKQEQTWGISADDLLRYHKIRRFTENLCYSFSVHEMDYLSQRQLQTLSAQLSSLYTNLENYSDYQQSQYLLNIEKIIHLLSDNNLLYLLRRNENTVTHNKIVRNIELLQANLQEKIAKSETLLLASATELQNQTTSFTNVSSNIKENIEKMEIALSNLSSQIDHNWELSTKQIDQEIKYFKVNSDEAAHEEFTKIRDELEKNIQRLITRFDKTITPLANEKLNILDAQFNDIIKDAEYNAGEIRKLYGAATQATITGHYDSRSQEYRKGFFLWRGLVSFSLLITVVVSFYQVIQPPELTLPSLLTRASLLLSFGSLTGYFILQATRARHQVEINAEKYLKLVALPHYLEQLEFEHRDTIIAAVAHEIFISADKSKSSAENFSNSQIVEKLLDAGLEHASKVTGSQ